MERKSFVRSILAIYGSPRKRGNTSVLLERAVRGATDCGASVEEIFLRDLSISPCLEIYACRKTGRCAIRDDFDSLRDKLISCDALMLASPMFFYSVSAHTKIFMDRCQEFWSKKYLIDQAPFGLRKPTRRALFISAGATRGDKLFDGALLSMKYFLDTLDMKLWQSLLYRGLDGPFDVLEHTEYLEETYMTGKELARAI
jgi:multimeric flavodoxin WrbA